MLPSPPRIRTILHLALPIIGSMVSQNILNLVDTWMVGELGKAALAAVGLGGFVTFASQALILGLSAGVQATAARRFGEDRKDELAVPLNGGLLLSWVLGVPLAAFLYWNSEAIFAALNDDPEVVRLGVDYYRMRLLGVVAVGMNFSFRGFWNGISMSQMYMRTLVLMHICNAALSYALIFGVAGFPAMGVTGAGAGTTLSVWLGSGIYTFLALRHAREAGFLQRLPSRQSLRNLVTISLPNSVQQLFFACGLTALFWIVGQVGTAELAAASVLINLTLVAILPAMGLGLAAASLVGQALGRGQPDDAATWGWDVVKLGVILLFCLGLPYLLVPTPILQVFLKEPDTLAVARLPLQLLGATITLEAFGMILMNALLGAGDSRRVMVVSVVTQWILFLPLAYLVGVVLQKGLLGIWIANAGYRALLGGSFALLWWRGDWTDIEV